MAGTFKAAALHCIDGRFVDTHSEAIANLRKDFGGALVDQLANPGVSASLLVEDDTTPGIYANLAGSALLHDIDTIVLIEHENCGMYGLLADNGESAFAVTAENEKDVHAKNAREAAEKLKSQFPEMDFMFRYARLDGTCEEL